MYPTGSEDYEADTETITLMNQDTPHCVTVTIKPDTYFEGNHTFELKLTSSDPAVILHPDETEINIIDDDSMPNS